LRIFQDKSNKKEKNRKITSKQLQGFGAVAPQAGEFMFTIKCEKCGKERKLNNKESFANNKDVIWIISNRDGDIFIECDCGNEVKE
jgi:hypothetical protein